MKLKKIVEWDVKGFNKGFVKPMEVETIWGVIFYPFLLFFTGLFMVLFYSLWWLFIIRSYWERKVYWIETSQKSDKTQ